MPGWRGFKVVQMKGAALFQGEIIMLAWVKIHWHTFMLKFSKLILQSLKRSTFPLQRWANDERTVSERWTHAERTLSERRVNDVWTLNASWWTICERWTMSERGTRTERKRERNVNGERTMNARWTFYSESLGYFHCIVLNLKFGKNLHVWVIKLCNFV